MVNTLIAISNGSSIADASEIYGVPSSTLCDFKLNKHKSTKSNLISKEVL